MAERNRPGSPGASLPNRSILILYGSETGNAEGIAVELGKMVERLRFVAEVDEMNEFSLSHLTAFPLTVFITSTTGQGDMPANASNFWKSLLRKRLPPDALSSVRFTLFGLGDSSYPKFNWAARKLQKRLQQLGAQEIFAPGEGDERHDDGIDSIYLPWSQEFREWLLTNYPLPPSLPPIPDDVQLPSKYLLRLAGTMDKAAIPATEEEQRRRFMQDREKSAALSHIDRPRSEREQLDADWAMTSSERSSLLMARQSEGLERTLLDRQRVDSLDVDNRLKDAPDKYLLEQPSGRHTQPPSNEKLPIPGSLVAILHDNVRVTPADHWQDVRFMSFYLPENKTSPLPAVVPGSTITIYPKNFPEDVQALIDRMGWDDIADKALEWENDTIFPKQDSLPVRRHCPKDLHTWNLATLRELLTHNLDFTAIPKRSFISEIAFYATNERERERLWELVKPGNSQEFYDYTSRPRRTILELLQDFPSVEIPWERVVSLFPVIRGREFSIASGGILLKPQRIEESDGIVIEILVALVEYKTIIRKPRQGLCSRYLKYLEEGVHLAVTIRSNEKGAPPWQKWHTQRPLIAIATGTGVAPIRNLIHERINNQTALNIRVHPTLLFFGCRSRNADFHFHEDWEDLAPFVDVIPAFSRDPGPDPDPGTPGAAAAAPPETQAVRHQPPPPLPSDPLTAGTLSPNYDQGRNYVQHQIRAHAKRICALLPFNPIICVCGSSGRMPQSVRLALLDAIVLGGGAPGLPEAEEVLKRLTYWQETW